MGEQAVLTVQAKKALRAAGFFRMTMAPKGHCITVGTAAKRFLI